MYMLVQISATMVPQANETGICVFMLFFSTIIFCVVSAGYDVCTAKICLSRLLTLILNAYLSAITFGEALIQCVLLVPLPFRADFDVTVSNKTKDAERCRLFCHLNRAN